MQSEINQLVAAVLNSTPGVLAYLLAICSLVVVGFALYVVLTAINNRK